MSILKILSLNDKGVINLLRKKHNYGKKEIASLRESSMDIRLAVLSKYFEELKGIQIEDINHESTSSRNVEMKHS